MCRGTFSDGSSTKPRGKSGRPAMVSPIRLRLDGSAPGTPLGASTRAPTTKAVGRDGRYSRHMSIEVTDGLHEGTVDTMTLELTLAEAEAVRTWLLKPAADGSAAIDDEHAKSAMVKLGAKLDYVS